MTDVLTEAQNFLTDCNQLPSARELVEKLVGALRVAVKDQETADLCENCDGDTDVSTEESGFATVAFCIKCWNDLAGKCFALKERLRVAEGENVSLKQANSDLARAAIVPDSVSMGFLDVDGTHYVVTVLGKKDAVDVLRTLTKEPLELQRRIIALQSALIGVHRYELPIAPSEDYCWCYEVQAPNEHEPECVAARKALATLTPIPKASETVTVSHGGVSE